MRLFVAPGVAAGGAAPPAAGCCLLPLRSGEWAALRRGGNIHNYFSASHKLRQSVVWNSEPSDHPAPGHQHNWYYEPLPSADPATAANIQRRNNVTRLSVLWLLVSCFLDTSNKCGWIQLPTLAGHKGNGAEIDISPCMCIMYPPLLVWCGVTRPV